LKVSELPWHELQSTACHPFSMGNATCDAGVGAVIHCAGSPGGGGAQRGCSAATTIASGSIPIAKRRIG